MTNNQRNFTCKYENKIKTEKKYISILVVYLSTIEAPASTYNIECISYRIFESYFLFRYKYLFFLNTHDHEFIKPPFIFICVIRDLEESTETTSFFNSATMTLICMMCSRTPFILVSLKNENFISKVLARALSKVMNCSSMLFNKS